MTVLPTGYQASYQYAEEMEEGVLTEAASCCDDTVTICEEDPFCRLQSGGAAILIVGTMMMLPYVANKMFS